MKILYGIQPTGIIHLGNYLGGLRKAIELQKNNEVVFLIAQFHAMTACASKELLDSNSLALEDELYKLGAKEVGSQSSEATRLAYELMCRTSLSDLFRMTQYKDKKNKIKNAGFLVYPCLMAADIIISGADCVLVGEDQLQHLELTRQLCRRMKFKIPETMLSETPRIMSIKDPTKKMSKSLGDEHCIYLDEDCTRKIMKAPTNSDGIRNLEQIARGLGVEYDAADNKNSKLRLIQEINKIMYGNGNS